jgi:hypothetical protein
VIFPFPVQEVTCRKVNYKLFPGKPNELKGNIFLKSCNLSLLGNFSILKTPSKRKEIFHALRFYYTIYIISVQAFSMVQE